jgi:trehalose 6-phosphate synthase
MPLAERQQRHQLLQGIRRQDVHWWQDRFLSALDNTH